MVDRPERVVAQLYGQAGRSISRPFQPTLPQICQANLQDLGIAGRTYRFATAKRCGRWAGHLSARIRGDRLERTNGYALRQSPLP